MNFEFQQDVGRFDDGGDGRRFEWGRSLEADEQLDIEFQRVGTVTRLGQAGKEVETRALAQHPPGRISIRIFECA